MHPSTEHHLQPLDYTVLPDHTARARVELARAQGRCRPKIYDSRDDGRLTIDWHDVQFAARQLGISWPITIGWMSVNDDPDALGLYTSRSPDKHEIRLRRGRSAKETAQTLRHELGHAQQRERQDFTSFERHRDAYEDEAWRLARTITYLKLIRDRTQQGVPGEGKLADPRNVDRGASISPPDVSRSLR